MRLLEYTMRSDVNPPTIDFRLVKFLPSDIPKKYAILSHRWTPNEVRQKDLKNGKARSRKGYQKLEFGAKQAAIYKIKYIWVDTCCIKKSNFTELTTAINSMFKWYKDATRCFVYLSDVSARDQPQSVLPEEWNAAFRDSAWFTRGWTLQELIAPASVEFFSKEGIRLGDKTSLKYEINQITGIPVDALCGAPLSQFTIKERLKWAENRDTKLEEDGVYCLLGIFNVYINLIYGEGKQHAMIRLRRELYSEIQNGMIRQQRELRPDLGFQLSLMAEPPWIVPFERNKKFTGRGKELATLEQQFITSDQTGKWAVTGLGGVGKTQLVVELLYRMRQEHPNCIFLWISAATSQSLYQGFLSLAQEMKLPGYNSKNANAIELVTKLLTNLCTGRWVLVFDNADDINLWTKPWSLNPQRLKPEESFRLINRLPQSARGFIIFTTRDMGMAYKLAGTDVIDLSPMDEATAKDMLQQHLAKPNLVNDAGVTAKLLAELAYIPLAIVQAAAYINSTRYSLQSYLARLKEAEGKVISLLSEDFKAQEQSTSSNNSIATTWLTSFEYIRQYDPLAADYLSLMACVYNKDIPISLLPPGPLDVQEATSIGTLVAYSLVERRDADSTLHLHRLVHLAARNWLRKEKILDRWEAKTCARLDNVFPSDDHKNRSIWRMYLPHAQYFLGSSQVGEDIKQRLSLITKSARCLYRDRRFNEAEVLFKQVQAAYNPTSESEPSDLENTTWLAANYRSQGRWQEAEELEVKVLEISKSRLGVDHPDTLTSMSNLASTYQAQGQWKEAEHLQLQVVKISKSKLGTDHPITLLSMNNLASTYQNYERWDEAEQLQTQVIKTYKTKFGADHPDTLTMMANLASTYLHQGRWQEAEQLDLQVVETSKDKLGTDHPDTIASMAGLASTYWNQERWEEAEKLFVQVVEAQTSKLGADHPDTLTSMANLASTYQELGRWQKAEELGLQVMETRKRKLGMNHPDTLISINNLASIYQKQKRWQAAEELRVQLAKISKRKLKADHPHMLANLTNLALIYRNQGRLQEAEGLDTQVLETRKSKLGTDHPDTLESMHNLALTWWALGRTEEAVRLMEKSIKHQTRVFCDSHPLVLLSASTLSEWKMQNPDAA